MELITAPLQEPYCLFLVGMQCRSWRSFWKVPLIARGMGRMIRELEKDPGSGLIWGESFVSFAPFTTLYLSYWKSSDDIHRFVSDPSFSHVSSSKDYFKRFSKNRDLGVWHETYEVDPMRSENLYLGMSPFGASAFLKTQRLDRSNRSFMQRLRRSHE